MINGSKTTWLVVGASPSAPKYFDALLGQADATITCNAGWQLFFTHPAHLVYPDYFFINDQCSCINNARAKRVMQSAGTEIITVKRAESALTLRGIDDADHLLEVTDGGYGFIAFTRGQYVYPQISGLAPLMFAINSGATRVLMCGMEGYKSNDDELVPDSFDGRLGKASGERLTRKWIGPFTQSVFDACPDVEFVFYGKPNFKINPSPNLQIKRTIDHG